MSTDAPADAELDRRLRAAFEQLQRNRFEEAIAASRPLVEDPRARIVASQILGAALAAAGRPDEALPYARRVHEAQPSDVGSLVRLLAVLDTLSLYEDVEQRARQALQRGRDNPALRLLFARALTSLGQADEAEQVLRELVRRLLSSWRRTRPWPSSSGAARETARRPCARSTLRSASRASRRWRC